MTRSERPASLRAPDGRVLEVFSEALERPEDERARWVADRCAGETDLQARVEALLRADARDTGVLETGASDLARDVLATAGGPGAGPEPVTVRHVGPYRLLREIGRGGMGIVYQAHDARLGRFVALKFLPRVVDDEGAAHASALAEARAVAALDHPNICTVYDLGETEDGRWYLAMAYYPGQTLADRLESGPLPLTEAVQITRQVLEALAVAHERGIVHRDIKPSNVLLTGRGLVKILDFGIATIRSRDPYGDRDVRPGTPAYMAPEQARGDAVDARSDLWATAVLLYEMVLGHRPFTGDDVAETLQAVLRAEVVVPARCPPAIADLLRRGLAKTPDERPADAPAFLAALRRAGEGPAAHFDLPAPATSFVGRDDQVDTVARLLVERRLVTLTGPGGVGKTRLAVEVARRLVVGDGVPSCFVPLESLSEPALVADAVARQLGLTPSSAAGALDLVEAAYRQSPLTLVLDTFEQLTDAAPSVARLVERCPHLRVLVTSRAGLRVRGEHEWPVPPLPVPPAADELALDALTACPPIALFAARARAVRPDFRVDADNRAVVTALCRALDGLPLAIELAAAQIKMLSPAGMLERLTDRTDLADRGPRDAPSRHRTLRETVAWTYDRLPAEARRLFRRLGALGGGGPLAAVEAVARVAEPVRDPLGALAWLVDHSLVQQEPSEREPRFTLLQTLQRFAMERLEAAGETAEAGAAHAAHVADLVERAAPELTGGGQREWVTRLDQARSNIRAAIEWAVDGGDRETAFRIAAGAWRLWLVRGPLAEGRTLLERVLALPGEDEPRRAAVVAAVGTLAHNQGDNRRAHACMSEALVRGRAADDPVGVASALTDLAWVDCELSRLESARRLSREALALHRSLGDARGAARALNNLGWIANYQADYESARVSLDEGLRIRREIGDVRGVAFALSGLAWAESFHGDLERARQLLDESAGLLADLHDPMQETFNRLLAAHTEWLRTSSDDAFSRLVSVVELARRCGNASLIAWSRTEAGRVALYGGRLDEAAGHLRVAREMWSRIDCPWGLALALVPAGELAVLQGDPSGLRSIAEAASTSERLHDPRGQAETWEARARLLAPRHRMEARALADRATAIRARAGVPRPPAIAATLRGLL